MISRCFRGYRHLPPAGMTDRVWTSDECDNITFRMEPHHHHHPGHAHPPATVSPSILRLSALERLAAVAVLIAALWGAVIWAMAS